jgi:hypothetical protein
LRDDVELSEAEKDMDMFITCSLNPDTVHEDKEIGKRIIAIIKEVNRHNCTRPCKRFGDKCKYGFPKFPLKETLVIDKNEHSDSAGETDKEYDEYRNLNYRKILLDIENLLKDDEKLEEIMSKFEEEQRKNMHSTEERE